MSVKHYKKATPAQIKALEKRAKAEKAKTPAQKKRSSTMSTPARIKKPKKKHNPFKDGRTPTSASRRTGP